MRFAYIDSNGNEVPIPSVDALALRIELGAINENTELYDAQADQWGPAHTHEIFHTLSRAAEEGDQGFVAPPPPVAPPPEPEPEPESVAAEPPAVDEPEAEPEAEEQEDVSLGLTLADAPPVAEDQAAADDAGLADLDLDLAPSLEAEPSSDDSADEAPLDAAPVEEAPLAMSPAADVVEAEDTPSFDFGAMDGGLELEEEFEAPAAEDAEPAMDFSMGSDESGAESADSGGEFGGGLEQPMDFTAEGFDGGGGSLDLEQPMSEFSPDAPPSWMDSDDSAGEADEVLDFSSVSGEVAGEGDGEDGDVPLRSRRTARNKPSAPKHKRERSFVGPIVGVAMLLAIGVGGYVAWPLLSERLAARGQPDVPPVVLPDIPAELLPQLRSVASATFASVVRDARASADPGLPGPPQEWLAGVYLGNASRYDGVETFWLGVQDVLDQLRGLDLSTFHARYQSEMTAGGVSAASAAMLLERADSGFVAAAAGRAGTYVRVETVVGAALELHGFVQANEDAIEYASAATSTTDPILEVRAEQAILDNLSELMAGVTEALDALDYLDRPTADGFWAAVVARLTEVGIQ